MRREWRPQKRFLLRDAPSKTADLVIGKCVDKSSPNGGGFVGGNDFNEGHGGRDFREGDDMGGSACE